MKFLLKVPLRLVTTAPPTVHPVLLSYAGAAGLAGLGLIGALMLTPAGQVVTQVVEPAREAVQAIIPMPLPRVFGLQPPLSKLPLPARPVSLIPANDATIALANDAQDAQDTLPPLNVAAPLAMPQSLAQPVVSNVTEAPVAATVPPQTASLEPVDASLMPSAVGRATVPPATIPMSVSAVAPQPAHNEVVQTPETQTVEITAIGSAKSLLSRSSALRSNRGVDASTPPMSVPSPAATATEGEGATHANTQTAIDVATLQPTSTSVVIVAQTANLVPTVAVTSTHVRPRDPSGLPRRTPAQEPSRAWRSRLTRRSRRVTNAQGRRSRRASIPIRARPAPSPRRRRATGGPSRTPPTANRTRIPLIGVSSRTKPTRMPTRAPMSIPT